jgi:hypothetical protein
MQAYALLFCFIELLLHCMQNFPHFCRLLVKLARFVLGFGNRRLCFRYLVLKTGRVNSCRIDVQEVRLQPINVEDQPTDEQKRFRTSLTCVRAATREVDAKPPYALSFVRNVAASVFTATVVGTPESSRDAN